MNDFGGLVRQAAGVKQAQQEIDGTKQLRGLVVSDALQARRDEQQQRMQDRREDIKYRLQRLRDKAADERLDKRERAQARRLVAQLEAQDKRLAESLQRYGNPVAGLDAQGNPVYVRFGKDGSQQVVPGITPPMASQSRVATTALTAMLKADTEALTWLTPEKNPKEYAEVSARMNQTRKALNELIGRAGVQPLAQSPDKPQATAPPKAGGNKPLVKNYTDADIKATAKKYGISEAEVRSRLGIK